MIVDKDRSYYIGASDTRMVMGNWKTKSFQDWWDVKRGVLQRDFTNAALEAGNAYEHKILDSLHLPDMEKDKQIIIDRLRVNLDGNTPFKIYEVKTHKAEKEFKVTKAYWQQVQVEMYASGIREACIVAYALEPEDYADHSRPIDNWRITFHEIVYDPQFIEEYKKRLNYLSWCLDVGVFPQEGWV